MQVSDSAIFPALIGALGSAFLMTLANISNRRESEKRRDIRELFHRINSVEKTLARLERPKRGLRGL